MSRRRRTDRAAARIVPSFRPPVPRPAVESRRRSFSRKRTRHTLPLIITRTRAVYLARCNTDPSIESSKASLSSRPPRPALARARAIHFSRSHLDHLSFHDARAVDARAMASPSHAIAHTVHALSLARPSPVPRRRASPTTRTTTTIAFARADDTIDIDAPSRAPTGGAARSFVGASFYDDPYDATGTTTATATARGAVGAIGASARRARGAMRPAANEKRRTKNRADEVIERRRRVEREMRSQMVEREVEKEVESLVKKRVRANAANDLIDFLCIDFDACDGLID